MSTRKMPLRSRNIPSTSNNDLTATESDSNGEESSEPFRIQPQQESRGKSYLSRNHHIQQQQQQQQQQTKWLSRNAIMARENRRKKKLYINALEQQNSKLKNRIEQVCEQVNSQSHLIADLRNEIRYLRSVLANSSDLCRLVQAINTNTGMSVSSSSLSLDNDVGYSHRRHKGFVVALNENCNVPKRALVEDAVTYPCKEERPMNDQQQPAGAFLSPKSSPSLTTQHDSLAQHWTGDNNKSDFGADGACCTSTEGGPLNFDFDDPFSNDTLLSSSDQLLLDDPFLPIFCDENSQQQQPPHNPSCNSGITRTTTSNNNPSTYLMSEEHNYYHAFPSDVEDDLDLQDNEESRRETNQDDIGVCLHVSKRKVSIEFCSGCDAKARRIWKMQED